MVINDTVYLYSCDSIEKLKAKLPLLDAELRDPAKFKDLYQFTFNYAKNPGQKGLDLEMAVAYWRIVLGTRFPYLELWCNFLMVSTRWIIGSSLCTYLTRLCFIRSSIAPLIS